MSSNKKGGKYNNTHFSREELVGLTKKYKEVLKDNQSQVTQGNEDKISRSQFRDVLHKLFDMSDDVMMDRILRVFDKNSDGFVSLDEWIKGLSVFLRGTLDEQIDFCFSVFDLNGDNHISREEMFQLLKSTVVKPGTEEDPEEGIKDLVEITLKKMDYDHDGKVSMKDFKTTVEADNLLLEAFGPCLPKDSVVESFMLMFASPNQ